MFHFKQDSLKNRLWVSIPLFVLGFLLSQISFATIWKYLGLFNQFLSVIVLWMAAMYLAKKGKNHWLLSLPATFMTAVCLTYLLVAPISTGGLALNTSMGYLAGSILALASLAVFLKYKQAG